mmetsp:Transcript_35448/g.102357  ORF Transcript_35448/g.102357 Transcript_35448/m.102357 type:complete len:387 (+) Transcript_35448:51-1211(+)
MAPVGERPDFADAGQFSPVSVGSKPHLMKSNRSQPSFHVREHLVETLREFNAREVPLGRHVIFKPNPDSIDCSGWCFTLFMAFRGRSLVHMALPLLIIMTEAVALAAFGDPNIMGDRALKLSSDGPFQEGFRMLSVPVAFLLVFRLNRAAVRYYDARAAFGKLIECARVLAGQAVQYLAHDPRNRDDMCRWVVVFAFTSKNFLRGSGPDPGEELAGLVTEDEADLLREVNNQPLLCLDRMRGAAWAGLRSCTHLPPSMAAQSLNQMEATIALMTGTTGAMERISNTPLPIAWVVHLRQILVLFLLGVPWTLHSTLGWAAPLVTLVICIAMLGLECAAVASERPFGENCNHLPMGAFCKVVSENVQQILTQSMHVPVFRDLECGVAE